MTTPAHFFGGYLALQATKKIWGFPELSQRQIRSLFLFGLFLSVAIDLDVFLVGGINGHHQQLTHYPFFWVLVGGGIFFAGWLYKSSFTKAMALVVLIASGIHMFLDLFGLTMGIHWMWPFSMQEFSITPLRESFTTEQARWEYAQNNPGRLIPDLIVITSGLLKVLYDSKTNFLKKSQIMTD